MLTIAPPLAACDHRPGGVLGAQEDPTQHDVDGEVPVLDREVDDRCRSQGARDVEQAVQRPLELDLRVGHRLLDLSRIGHAAGEGHVGVTEFLGAERHSLGIEIEGQDPTALRDDLGRDGLADPGGRTGDQGALRRGRYVRH